MIAGGVSRRPGIRVPEHGVDEQDVGSGGCGGPGAGGQEVAAGADAGAEDRRFRLAGWSANRVEHLVGDVAPGSEAIEEGVEPIRCKGRFQCGGVGQVHGVVVDVGTEEYVVTAGQGAFHRIAGRQGRGLEACQVGAGGVIAACR